MKILAGAGIGLGALAFLLAVYNAVTPQKPRSISSEADPARVEAAAGGHKDDGCCPAPSAATLQKADAGPCTRPAAPSPEPAAAHGKCGDGEGACTHH